ncbi:LysM domain-containing protein [Rhodoferax sp. TBRC 17198]|uniref:LysM peptidoglycan-binding domain-containing protein n=1 Tax=Rhodoferax potami TaxID=3068338 RepID=UPI0028BD260E|nr:LysM domain-containing protein [Rhodoferax sp. TBRC 17198]MDT7524150.1 LysM domain-containing protein [Rhodoferax sp. TBRC 17198]
MTTHLMAKSRLALAAVAALAGALTSASVGAQSFPITSEQRQTAAAVAQKGVPLSELAANAPDRYTIKSGDTLWGISTLFLKSPWRWPELWGMNLEDIKNPHRIYPGQILLLERNNGVATLRLANAVGTANGAPDTVRLSPRTRSENLPDFALPTLRTSVIEAFLAEPMIVDEAGLEGAARIVATQEERVLLGRGDRAYARGTDSPLLDNQNKEQLFRVFRNAKPLKDPGTGEVLAYEAQYVGKAVLARSESTSEVNGSDGKVQSAVVPATIDIVSAKEEMRVGDRLIPEPPKQFASYTPRAPEARVNGRIVSVYGSTSIVNASQNQVVAISLGKRDGIESGHVLAIQKDGARVVDRSDPSRPLMKLPDERNGILMVFSSYERVSYALILEISDSVRIGDRLINPR